MTDQLTTLLQRLDEKAAQYSILDKYAAGQQPLAFLSPTAREALGNRLSSLAVNVPRVLVEAVAERLRVLGFKGADVWTDWLANDLDQISGTVHREALILGDSFVTVWADDTGAPLVSAESARQVSTLTDPGTRQTIAALKRWETAKTTEAVLYGPDAITRLRANQTGATTAGFNVVEEISNPLGVVPVVRFKNGSRLLDDGVSEMRDVLTLTDALVKLTSDMMVASEYTARPRRWATGLELEEIDILDDEGQPTGEMETVNPIGEGDRLMVNESPDGKFGQLPGSVQDLGRPGQAIQMRGQVLGDAVAHQNRLEDAVAPQGRLIVGVQERHVWVLAHAVQGHQHRLTAAIGNCLHTRVIHAPSLVVGGPGHTREPVAALVWGCVRNY